MTGVGAKSWQTRKAEGWESRAEKRAKVLAEVHAKAEAESAIQARFGGDLVRVAEWAVDTCLAAGSSVHTAYLVAGELTRGIAESRR